jgi:hypothetical protein
MAAPVSIYHFEGVNAKYLREDFSLQGRLANRLVTALWGEDVTANKIMKLLDTMPIYDLRHVLWRGAAIFTKKGTYPAQAYQRDATAKFLESLTQFESRVAADPRILETDKDEVEMEGLQYWVDLSNSKCSLTLKERLEKMRVIHTEDIKNRESTEAWVAQFIKEAKEAYVPQSYSMDFTALPCYPNLPPVLSTIQLSAITEAVVEVPPFKYVENW